MIIFCDTEDKTKNTNRKYCVYCGLNIWLYNQVSIIPTRYDVLIVLSLFCLTLNGKWCSPLGTELTVLGKNVLCLPDVCIGFMLLICIHIVVMYLFVLLYWYLIRYVRITFDWDISTDSFTYVAWVFWCNIALYSGTDLCHQYLDKDFYIRIHYCVWLY